MVFSPYTLTLSMIGLAAVGVFTLSPSYRPGIDWKALSGLLRPWRYPAYLAITLLFLITLIGSWDLQDSWYFKARLRIKLPYILLPLLFMVLPRFSVRQRNNYLFFLLILISITSIGVLIHYGLNIEAVNEMIRRGKPMPTPRNHIRYSMLVVLAILSGGYLSAKKYYWRYDVEKRLIPLLTIFLFIFLHILSVKTGLVVAYATLLFVIFRYLLFSRHSRWAIAGLIVLIALPFLAYHLVPSFRSKMMYTRYDYYMYMQNRGEVYGDSGRIISLQVGWDLFRENPLMGTGAGNLKKAVEKKFGSDEIDYWETLMPHNQYLFTAAATGILGLSVFLFSFLFPLFYRKAYKDFLLLSFHVLLFTLFLIDHPCETALGVGYHSFFLLLFLSAGREVA
jgi:O-antigen ligase